MWQRHKRTILAGTAGIINVIAITGSNIFLGLIGIGLFLLAWET